MKFTITRSAHRTEKYIVRHGSRTIGYLSSINAPDGLRPSAKLSDWLNAHGLPHPFSLPYEDWECLFGLRNPDPDWVAKCQSSPEAEARGQAFIDAMDAIDRRQP